MLARTFKTPKELKISEQEFDALVKAMQMLERGEAKFVRDPDVGYGGDAEPLIDRKKFNMNFTAMPVLKSGGGICGSVCCIGGWAAHYMGMKTYGEMDNYVHHSHGGPIEELYFPGNRSDVADVYNRCRPHHAAQAIGNFLATGDPHWEDIFA